jgi:hypothetical protein
MVHAGKRNQHVYPQPLERVQNIQERDLGAKQIRPRQMRAHQDCWRIGTKCQRTFKDRQRLKTLFPAVLEDNRQAH